MAGGGRVAVIVEIMAECAKSTPDDLIKLQALFPIVGVAVVAVVVVAVVAVAAVSLL